MEADLEERLPDDRLVREIAAEHEDVRFGACCEDEALGDRDAVLTEADRANEHRGLHVPDRTRAEGPRRAHASHVARIQAERAARLDVEKEGGGEDVLRRLVDPELRA